MADDAERLLSVLTSRRALLERIRTKPMRTAELVECLDVSRSTVCRGLTELEAFDLIDCRDGRYVTTTAGNLALEEYGRFVGRVDDVVAARSVLSALPTTTTFDPVLLEGASVVSARRVGTQAALAECTRLIRTAASQRIFVPSFLHRLVSAYCDAIRGGLECDLAFTPSALDRLVRSYREPITTALGTGRMELREATTSIPYSLIISRGDRTANDESGPPDPDGPNRDGAPAEADAVAVLIYGDGGLEGVLYNDTPDAIRWADSTFDDIWTDAKTLTLSQ